MNLLVPAPHPSMHAGNPCPAMMAAIGVAAAAVVAEAAAAGRAV